MQIRRRAICIVNPNAGRGGAKIAARVGDFCARLEVHGVRAEVNMTRHPGDATRLAQAAIESGAQEVIVSGGDGTINEAIQALAGTEARLGLWPRGTANVLARELGIPRRAEKAADIIGRGHLKQIYLGCSTRERTGEKRYFLLMAGVGLDASIVQRVRPRLKRRIGEAAFWLSGFEHLAGWRPAPFEIQVNGEILPATFAAIGKAPHYGGKLAITPGARLETAAFEICVVNSGSRLRYMHLLSHAVMAGVSKELTGVRIVDASRARVVGDTHVQIDGELWGELPMSFEVAPLPVNVITNR